MPIPPTSMTVVNETINRGRQVRDLIKKYVLGNCELGFRSIGANPDIVFPIVMVVPKMQKVEMVTTAKFRLDWTFGIYWYVRDNWPEQLIADSTQIAEMLIKLFSNNALQDFGTPGQTNNFKVNNGFWLDSAFSEVRWSVQYLDPKPEQNASRYEMAGRIMFSFFDIILK